MADLAQLIASLSPAELERLQARLGKARGTRQPTPAPPPRPAAVPLAPTQQRFWIFDQLQPGSAAYRVQAALGAAGRLQPAILRACVQRVAQRHEALRTTFAVRNGQPVQVVAADPHFDFTLVDLSAVTRQARTETARRVGTRALHRAAGRPFDLGRGPLLRILLLRYDEAHHAIYLGLHHIISDAWSVGIMVGEIVTLYEAFALRRPVLLPDLPWQLADFALWQRQRLEDGLLDSQLAYWRQQLADLPALALPSDRPRPVAPTLHGAQLQLRFPRSAVMPARLAARQRGGTLFTVLVAAFHVLLQRLTGQHDVVVGTAISNRGRAELHHLVGCFVNTLALRGRLADDPAVGTLLQRTGDLLLAAHEHQDLPFEILVEALAPQRDGARPPLVQVLLVLQNAEMPTPAIPGLRFSAQPLREDVSPFDLSLSVAEAADGDVEGHLSYSSELFDATTVDRWMVLFQRLVAAFGEDPARRLSQLQVLPPAARQQLLREWNPPLPAPPAGRRQIALRSDHLIFRRGAEQPDAVALVADGVAVTYHRLAADTARLAAHLRALGVGDETIVGICVQRSPAMVIAMLAVWRAGGAYLPLDPAYPAARLAFMLDETAAPVVLSGAAQRQRMAAAGRTVVDLDAFLAAPAGNAPADEKEEDEDAILAGDSLAYVIYTSGSTGRPKGVMVAHRELAISLTDFGALLGFTPDDQVLMTSSMSFDASVWWTFGPLVAGSTLVLGTEGPVAGTELGPLFRRHRINKKGDVPSLLGLLSPADQPQVEVLLAGGEACPREVVERWAPHCRFFNVYGPTEASVGVTALSCRAGSGRPPTLGRPLSHARVYLVSAALEPVPLGSIGELVIGGERLARGYLGRPAASAVRFVPDPWSPQPGARLYRSGDLARHRADGEIDFLGRRDHQIKVRGFRVELGEVEAALHTLSGVTNAVVIVHGEGAAGRLVAYLAPIPADGDVAADDGALRSALAQRLPAHMVPSLFVRLAALPLLPNDKVDRAALPAPTAAPATAPSAAPATPTEARVADLWAAVLGCEEIGRDDDFFALGGQSLLATQLASRLRETFGVDVPLPRLFDQPTVAGMAAAIEGLTESGAAAVSSEPLVPTPRDGLSLPLSFAQERLWFLSRLAPDNSFYNMYGGHTLQGPFDARAFGRAFDALLCRHEALRTTFEEEGGRPVQVVAPPATGEDTLPTVDLTALAAGRRQGEVERLSRREARRPFALDRGPLVRAVLLRLGDERHAFFLNLHHIVGDGWSMGVMLDELMTLYQAFASGEPPPLPPLPVQYPDFARWQRRWLAGDELERQLGYWRQRLADLPGTLRLPTDRPRPAVETFRGGQEIVSLAPGLVADLQRLARGERATLAMVALTAFQALLHRTSGQRDLAVGMAVANRNRHEIERLIGFFVNTLVIRADLAAAPRFRQLLRQVRARTLEAYAHQDLPFETLVNALRPERDASRNPLIQVMFGYQNVPQPSWRLDELTLRPLAQSALDTGTAKFDLTLFLFEVDGGLTAAFEYNRDLFDPTTMRRLARQLEALLRAAAAGPDRAVAALPLLDAAGRHQLLREWSRPAAAPDAGDPALEPGLDTLFRRQVAGNRGAPAVLAADALLTYGELDERATALARQLVHHLGPRVGEHRIGLCLGRSPALVVAMVAVVRARAAYVPLNPDDPPERLTRIVEDAGIGLVITSSTTAATLPADLVTVPVDADGRAEANTSAEDEILTTDVEAGSSLAYVIYTSGSTGMPKGVEVTQRAVSRLALGADYVPLGPHDRVAIAASPAFDAITFEVWAPLLVGGCGVVLPTETLLSAPRLHAALQAQAITTLFITTALFNRLAREDATVFAPLTHLLFGGEAVDPQTVALVLQAGPPRRLLHVYGPTESTTFATWQWVERLPGDAPTVPIGRAIAHTRLHVLEAGGEPAPPGVAGELVLGGDGLARAYLGRPRRTAARFVPDPFAAQPGARLYRTGDRVRHRADGAVSFLGRFDHQVKVRGFRVELGEIESHLEALAPVKEAVVLAEEAAGGEKRLVACVVADRGAAIRGTGDEENEGDHQAHGDRVAQWAMIFDDLYGQEDETAPGAADEAADDDPTFDIVGWRSTYTGAPLPRPAMREWLDDTVRRIRNLAPRRVLEIGCGTGMLLFRIAPHSERYCGTDISAQALDELTGRIAGLPDLQRRRERGQLRLVERPAHQLDDLPDADAESPFDLVILNSVVQYFPDAAYLVEVLSAASDLLGGRGTIFLGDLRSQPLLPAFHASLALAAAPDDTSLDTVRQRAEALAREENELVLHPNFFAALRQQLPAIQRIAVHPKRGQAHNELTAFRYQVVLHLGADAAPADPSDDIPWRHGDDLLAIRHQLEDHEPALLGLRGLANARTAAAALTRQHLAGAPGGTARTAGQLRREIATAVEDNAELVDPHALALLADELGYDLELGWADPGDDGRFDALLRRRDTAGSAPLATFLPPPNAPRLTDEASGTPPWQRWANHPVPQMDDGRLSAAIRAELRHTLPPYMVPADIVLLDTLPLTATGKVDRRELSRRARAAAERSTAAREGEAAPPRTPMEAWLLTLWRELLEQPAVGPDDDFFALGGHSLLATQVVSRLRQEMQVEVPLRTIFEAPTVSGLAARIEAAKGQGRAAQLPPITPRTTTGDPPLSWAQERLWFLYRFEAETAARYNEAAAFRLRGPLHGGVFRHSLDTIVRRHESLRTSFPEKVGQAVQRIAPAATATFPLLAVDLTAVPPNRRHAAAQELGRRQARRPYDLAAGPLVRGLLVRLDADDHAVLFSFHHIVFDGWSMGRFSRELTALYGAFLAGRPAPLAPLAVQYADFARWQRQHMTEAFLQPQIDYWRQQLAAVPPLDLPADRPRGQGMPRPAVRQVRIDGAVAAPLRALARRHGATLYMVCLAAYQVLLQRLSGAHDLAVGTPVANRNRQETEDLLGFFINMLVMRGDLRGDPTFAAFLERTREVCLGAYAHQDVPFERLVEVLQPTRDLDRPPFFQVTLQVLDPPPPLALPGLEPEPFETVPPIGKFDLNLPLVDLGDELAGSLEYDAARFDPTTVERLARRYLHLLAAVGRDAGRPLSAVTPLVATERHQLLAEWNDTPMPLGEDDVCLHQLVEARADADPDGEAFRFHDEVWRRGQLETRANRLAHRLIAHGVGAEVSVGLCLERGPALVVSMLAILKAGGALLPLDPKHPPQRLAHMLVACPPPVILTRHALTDLFPGFGGTLLDPDQEADAATDTVRPRLALGPILDPQNLAYIIHTSGSTGLPKGVMVSHRAVVRYLRFPAAAGLLQRGDVVLQRAETTFDPFVRDLFAPLSFGAPFILADDETTRDPAAMLATLRRQPISRFLTMVPALLTELLREAEADKTAGGTPDFGALRHVMSGGDTLPPRLARRLRDHGIDLVNSYGPTEAVVSTTFHRLQRDVDDWDAHGVPIGRPLSPRQLYVAGARLRLVPAETTGELLIGGPDLARGYAGRPSETARRFVPDPWSPRPGARLYRSGDRVRRRHDGALLFLGRIDRQLKIRGLRIEPGEIERVLESLPAVGRAAVVLADHHGQARLLAYVVAATDSAPSVDDLRRALRDRLPPAMVPDAFMALDALPTTATGKVDRQALASRKVKQLRGEQTFVAPAGPIETALAEIWADLLHPDAAIGAGDSFFDLGGHSLVATQVVSRLRDVLQVEVPLRTIFETPTLGALAARIEQDLSEGHDADISISLPPITPREATDDPPLSWAQERLWFLYRLHAETAGRYNEAAAFRLRGPLHLDAFRRSLDEIVRRHESLRTTFPEAAGRAVQRITPAAAARFPLLIMDLTALPAGRRQAAARHLGRQQAQRAYDLGTGPLARGLLARLGADDHAVLFSFHHIIFDGWSTGRFSRELTTLYTAFAAGRPSPLVPLTVQYADFALWQRQHMTGAYLNAQLAYWHRQLAEIPPLELPMDRPPIVAGAPRPASRPLTIDAAIAAPLRALARRRGATLYMVCLAAFQALLHHVTGARDLAVGTPVANRNRRQTEDLLGFFVNMLVMRGDLSGDPTFEALLDRTREVCLGAYAHQDVPFERLVEALQPSRDLDRSPFFQVTLQVLDPPPPLDLPDLEPEPFAAAPPIGKFDLSVPLADLGEAMAGSFEYDAARFDAVTVERLVRRYLRLLEAVGRDAARALSDLRPFAAAERHQLLAEWNNTPMPLAGAEDDGLLLLHQLVEARADADPDTEAFRFHDERWSLGQLEVQANRLAHCLIAHGVGPEVPVGLCLERGPALVTAVLAILKAGGVLLPLDPMHPPQRLSHMLRACPPPLILTREVSDVPAADRFPGFVGTLLDPDQEAEATADTTRPRVALDPDHLAYIIHTSGSTGQPKGVMVSHRAVVRYLRFPAAAGLLQAGDISLQRAEPTFDPFLRELFVPLSLGTRFVLADDEMVRDPAGMLATLHRHRINRFLAMVPALLAELLREAEAGKAEGEAPGFGPLRHIMVGGDTLPPQLARRLHDHGLELVNSYGPTESVVSATFHRLHRDVDDWDAYGVPIGRPISARHLHVADRRLHLVPAETAGELLIGGPGLARGYAGRPAETAHRFVPDPWSARPGARLYRSGDRVRRRHDGAFLFLGRIDRQVKIRGLRIEPGEVEPVLESLPAVHRAAVVVADHHGEPRLLAYLVAASDPAPSADELRRALRDRLPPAMVPDAFMALDALPTTATGKVDRRALASRETERLQEERTFVAPSGPIETALAEIWTGLLHPEAPVSTQDNFFDLGGHSLLATQVVAQIRDALDVDLPVRAVFEGPTIAELAEAVVKAEAEKLGEGQLAAMLDEVEDLSEEEIEALLAAEEEMEG